MNNQIIKHLVYDIYIGIDTGVNTGFAVWCKSEKKLLVVSSFMIHTALDMVQKYHFMHNGSLKVRVEDARLRTWIPRQKNARDEAGLREGAGSVKRDAKIWEDFLTDNNIPFELVAPKNNKTKMKAEYFRKVKTETRRTKGLDIINENPSKNQFIKLERKPSGELMAIFHSIITGKYLTVKSPYDIGDEIWIKETYALVDYLDPGSIVYKADFKEQYGAWEMDQPNKFRSIVRIEKWRSSMFMPRQASRILGEITAVHVEHLHDITDEGAIAEGIEWDVGLPVAQFKRLH